MAGSSEATGEKDDPLAESTSPKTDINNGDKPSPAPPQEPTLVDEGAEVECDDFGLPVKPKPKRAVEFVDSDSDDGEPQAYGTPGEKLSRAVSPSPPQQNGDHGASKSEQPPEGAPKEAEGEAPQAQDAPGVQISRAASRSPLQQNGEYKAKMTEEPSKESLKENKEGNEEIKLPPTPAQLALEEKADSIPSAAENPAGPYALTDAADRPRGHAHHASASATAPVIVKDEIIHGQRGAFSAHSHQALAPKRIDPEDEKEEEEEWKIMPAFAPFDLYDDENRLVAREEHDSDNEASAYTGLGGAGKGYTRVQVDEDARSATSMDDNTDYLFKPKAGTELHDEDEEQRDPLAQLQATKTILSEPQRIAYVGVTRLAMANMVKELEALESTKKTKKGKAVALENLKMWSQQMMVRLYGHMEINSSEQIMIEQLAEHGVQTGDMTPALMQNARVKNPMAEEKTQEDLEEESEDQIKDNCEDDLKEKPQDQIKDNCEDDLKEKSEDRNIEYEDESEEQTSIRSPKLEDDGVSVKKSKIEEEKTAHSSAPRSPDSEVDAEDDPVPEYTEHDDGPKPEDMSLTQLGTGKNIDIDLRWTVLCDLFLVLLVDSVYDSRSRVLLERVGEALEVSWLEICRFEKRVTESLEMQETANKETWDEAEHLENRRKAALRRRYMMMGLATVGGGLVIGLSAGALAPVIGAGLAAGFTTIGVTGTGTFLTGAGASAIIATGAVGIGGSIGHKASRRRMGAVKTFEYRPLHNNKRVNLIVTVSGWMSSKVDDVRLPFSTVNPVMGDMYSVLWEPEMLTSMGDTINILATEALTQTVQQVLGSTILIALMASLQLPIVLSKLSYLIDNPWSVSMGRANAAGLILADSLIDRNLGVRPITLVGFSLGARVIFACLRELRERGAFGIVQNVFLFGSPVIANKDEYLGARAVVSGRFVNGYSTNDWILGYLFRATGGGIMRVAGLAKVEGVAGVENIDVTELVAGHMAYRTAMPKILRKIGWEVESDEFAEIEDPDPENHAARQRELIKEIDEARRRAEEKPGKRRFGFFKRGKLAQKKGWETYDAGNLKTGEDDFGTAAAERQSNVLFDIEAIKRELASEQIEVKQLPSTLPPIKLSSSDFKNPDGTQRNQPSSPYTNLHESKSYDGPSSASTPPETLSPKVNGQASQPSLASSQNPFNKGYDEYNFSADSVSGLASADHGKLSFDDLQRSPSPTHSPHVLLGSPGMPPGSPLKQEIDKKPSVLQRPALESTATAPAPSPAAGPTLEHNAWADEEDDPDFGKEKEISMTFS